MRRVLLALCLASACGDGAGPPPPAARPAVGTVAARPRATPAESGIAHPSIPGPSVDLGPWTPRPDDLALAARLGDPETREAAWLEIGNLSPDRYIDVLRAGLRLQDPRAAYQCATELSWRHLDAAEMSRFARIVFEANFDPSIAGGDAAMNFAEVFEAASSADVAWLCERFLATPPENWPETSGIATLHKSLRLDAADAVFRLAAHPAAAGADEIEELARQLRLFTDAGRTTSLEPGLPYVLACLLRRASGPEDARPDTATTAWALRWFADATPGPQDAAVVVALHDAALLSMPRELLALRVAGQAAVRDRLEPFRREVLTSGPSLSPAGLLLLGVSTDDGSLRLPDGWWMSGDEESIALALAWDTDRSAGQLADRLTSHPDDESLAALHDDVEQAIERRAEHGIDVPAAAIARIAAALGPEHVWLGMPPPWARTKRVAEAHAAALATEAPDFRRNAFDDLGFLEVATPETLHRSLRAAAAQPHHDAHDIAKEALARLGDQDALLARLATPPTDDGEYRPLRMWRGAGPRVREALAARLREGKAVNVIDGILALVMCDLGRDGPMDLDYGVEWEKPLSERIRAAAELAVNGRAAEAVLAVAQLEDGTLVTGMGAIRDERIGAWLRARLGERHTKMYAEVLGELALHGDAAARAEFVRTIRAGHYRFVDDMHPLHRGMGDPLAAVPLWIDVVESNCCQKIGAVSWFEDTFEIDMDRLEGPLETPASILRDWFATNGPRLRWSEIAGKFVVGPR